ncbi:MAG: cell division protein SepF [Aristaeellaceae bacterium]
MSLMDSMQALLDKVRQRAGGEEEEQTSNMANGGFSGYRPATSRHRVNRETGRQAVPEQNTGYDMGNQQGAYATASQGVWQTQQGTGYQQGAGYQQGTGYQQATGYQQGTGYQQATGYQQGTGYQQAPTYQGADYQNAWPNNGYQPTNQGPWQQPQQQSAWQNQNSYGQEGSWQNGQGAPNNISYMPMSWAFVDKNGRAYSHVERVAQVTQVPSCYRIIEFMRNGESVIVNTEMINDPAETDRCLDMLYGAACALGCTLTRISSQKEIYLISPETVMVVPYEGIRRMSDQDINARWPDPDTMYGRYDYGWNQQQSSYQERGRSDGRRGYAGRYDEGYGGYQPAYAR